MPTSLAVYYEQIFMPIEGKCHLCSQNFLNLENFLNSSVTA